MREVHVRGPNSRFSGRVGQGTPDVVLVESIAKSNRLAMEVLFLRYRLPVYRQLAKLVGDRATAEDLLSDTFLDVWRKAGAFRGNATVATWLWVIARNKAVSTIRSRYRERRQDVGLASLHDESDDQAVTLLKKERSDILHQQLDALSAKHREVIELVYYQEKSPQEVATFLGTPHSTVKTRIFYARKRLGALLADVGVRGPAY